MVKYSIGAYLCGYWLGCASMCNTQGLSHIHIRWWFNRMQVLLLDLCGDGDVSLATGMVRQHLLY